MTMTLERLSEKMKDIDFAMLATIAPGGAIGSRPMSNNREVDYDGDAWFFTDESAQMVADIAANLPGATQVFRNHKLAALNKERRWKN